MNNDAKFDSKKFGTLLSPGDTVTIRNTFTGASVSRTVHRFDGLEWVFTEGGNLGHSGYVIDSPTQFTVLVNGEPFLVVTKNNTKGDQQ